jgi:hypothetical protein
MGGNAKIDADRLLRPPDLGADDAIFRGILTKICAA